ncbi:type II toxin-antitoxin system HigB family toxin [Moorena sp. SIO2C4]|nr:type II toxin-antitoxin system HigB family toxin [Moorena sp. SIO2C4]
MIKFPKFTHPTYIDYQAQIIFIRAILTHADYDKEKCKNDNWFNNS